MKQEANVNDVIIIDHPTGFSVQIIKQIYDLIADGGQIPVNHIKVGLHRASILGALIKEDKVACTCCLKNPTNSYRDNVFINAGVPDIKDSYNQELGYIVTHPDYEAQHLCQKLITEIFPLFESKPIFATTRKPAMIHILKKFGFKPAGNIFKNDLTLLVKFYS